MKDDPDGSILWQTFGMQYAHPDLVLAKPSLLSTPNQTAVEVAFKSYAIELMLYEVNSSSSS